MATDMDWSESRREKSVEMREQDDSPERERWAGSNDDMEEDGLEKSRELSKHRSKSSKDRSKSSSRREDKHRSKDRDRLKNSHGSRDRDKEGKDVEKNRVSSRDRDKRKEDRDEQEKEKTREKPRDKDIDRSKHKDREHDRDCKDRAKEKERELDREKDLERDSERGRDKDRGKDKSRDKEKDREKDREREREREKHRDKENDRERSRNILKERSRETDQDKERSKEKERSSHKQRDEGHERNRDLRKDDKHQIGSEDVGVSKHNAEDETETLRHQQSAEGETTLLNSSTMELEERILKMKEERLKKSEGASEVLAWVNRSRKLEEKRNAEREKALQLSKIFEEQDNMNQAESDDDVATLNMKHDLSGLKVLHGVDKVLEGGAVVLTLKDQSILTDGDLNEEADALENVEIGEQKRRDDAYKAAKKKTGDYDDKFNDEPGVERKVLPQYDDPIADEGMILDASGRLTGEAEKKLEELRKRIQGVPTNKNFEDLNASGKMSSDYYTEEEMVKFKKPKKKKSLRKKEKLDYDALEAEAKSAGLGIGDLGSRNDDKRQALREEQERKEAEMRSSAYQSALAKADEASKALRLGQNHTTPTEEDEAPAIGDDDEELQKSLQRARKLALQKQGESVKSGPQAIALLASSAGTDSAAENQNSGLTESEENRIVFTEMDEFVWGLQFDEEAQKPEAEDVFMEEDEPLNTSVQEKNDEDGGWSELKEREIDGIPEDKEEEVVPDETIHEVAVGKGLSGALKLLKERGSLKESIEWGGRNMDKKKSKLVGIVDDDGQKEIRIERTDEYGRILTPKEAFRLISHKFHGKGPGKMKQEKRMRQYQEELKVKQMKNSDTPSLSVERMREAQAQLKTPYLVLSGHVKPGQTSDPRSGFATVEKDLPGGLTPMLGDKKVEYFLGKRKLETGDTPASKKMKS